MLSFAGHGVSGQAWLSLSRAWWSPLGFDQYFSGMEGMSCHGHAKGWDGVLEGKPKNGMDEAVNGEGELAMGLGSA